MSPWGASGQHLWADWVETTQYLAEGKSCVLCIWSYYEVDLWRDGGVCVCSLLDRLARHHGVKQKPLLLSLSKVLRGS